MASNPRDRSPSSIETHVDEAFGAVAARAVQPGEGDGVDAYVVACFGDTGAAARDLARYRWSG